MSYLFKYAIYPKKKSLLKKLNSGAKRLEDKFKSLRVDELGISDYNQRYLREKLQHLKDTLQKYAYLLAWSTADRAKPLKDFILVDHGGGCGVLSLLAKEVGIGRVIYNDIYDVSCRDAQLIAREIHNEADAYICGDIDELILYLTKHSICIDAISSNDVIEHIYDIEKWFKSLHLLSGKSFCGAFATTANIHNPRINRKIRRMQIEAEYVNREAKWGHKERDSLRSYLDIRKDIIANYEPSLSEGIIKELAKATRGLNKDDIEKRINEFKKTGNISYKPDHPTNTCDPYTGNWCEHLMRTNYLRKLLENEQFEVKILSGYYSSTKQIYRQLIKYLLNAVISVCRHRFLTLSPYYVVYAKYKP
jgi:hypothetical protein